MNSIKFRLPLAFGGVALYVCVLAGYAAWALVDTIRAAATHEVERIAEVVSYAVWDDVVSGDRKSLQDFVRRFHLGYRRDIVIVDRNRKVLADADPGEVGTDFHFDPGNERRWCRKWRWSCSRTRRACFT